MTERPPSTIPFTPPFSEPFREWLDRIEHDADGHDLQWVMVAIHGALMRGAHPKLENVNIVIGALADALMTGRDVDELTRAARPLVNVDPVGYDKPKAQTAGDLARRLAYYIDRDGIRDNWPLVANAMSTELSRAVGAKLAKRIPVGPREEMRKRILARLQKHNPKTVESAIRLSFMAIGVKAKEACDLTRTLRKRK